MTVIIVALIGILFAQYNRRTRHRPSPEDISNVPHFAFIDQRGELKKSTSLYSGKNLYIQFLNRYMPDEVDLFKQVYTEWKNHDIWFLLICGSGQIGELGAMQSDRLSFYDLEQNRDRPSAYSAFGLEVDDSYFFVFNSRGKKLLSARSSIGYERGAKPILNELLTGTRFRIEELMERGHVIDEYEWLRPIGNIVAANKEYKYYVFSLLTRICDSCAGSEIIRFMKTFARAVPQKVFVASFLSSRFAEPDIINLKSQLEIDYPVYIANDGLRTRWDELIAKYSDDILSDIVFILDGTGKILDISYRACGCFNSFTESASRLIGDLKERVP